MKKLVRTNLTNTADRRGTNDLNIQFYSHDKNNAGFEFVVKNETDLSQYTAKVLFKFRDSNSTWEANGTIEGNVIKVNFNTDLIARCEEVLGYLFLDSDSDSLDIFKFKFNVVLSEIDKGEVANRQIKHVNNIGELELVTKSQLRDELSKLQINGVDLTNYLTTTVAEETYATKQELRSYALSKDVPSINGLVTEEQLKTANNGVLEEVKKLGYAKTTEVPAAYNDSALSERVTALENRPSTGGAVASTTESEMRGTGMPNGVVEAPIGATYIDTTKTNGALKWIKTTDGGNTGWKVVEGDTGWLTIFTKDFGDDTKLSLKIRRINNMVNVLFEGEFIGESFIKTFYDNFDNKKLMANGRITDGFKPASTISVPAHVEKNGNEGFQAAGAFLFDIQNNTFEINLFTSSQLYNSITDGLANINFNYVTYEEWPTELPTI